MQDALGVLSAKALFDGPELPVHVRCAQYDGAYWLDLADAGWRAVKVTRTGWEVVVNPSVKFLRPRGMLPLPEPEHGGTIEELRHFVNFSRDDDWALLLAWIVSALRPSGPYPILVVNGEAGSAKSTTCRIVRALIDPNAAPLRSEPREGRDLYIAACNSWVCAFDNLSGIRAGLSDDLCRLATGAGFSTRELFSDREESIFDSMRPIMLNGIEDVATRGDLADRTVVLTLPPIAEQARRTESDLNGAFERVRPGMLGALLDAVSCAMERLPSVQLAALPRMADFAQWAVAAEPGLDLPAGTFISAYAGNTEGRTESVIEAASIGTPLLGFINGRGHWAGTAQELVAELSSERWSDERARRRRDWPNTPRAMSGALRRLAPALREAGIRVEFEREGGGKTGRRRRMIKIEKSESSPSLSSLPPSNPIFTTEEGDSEVTGARDGVNGASPSIVPDRPAQKRESEPETAVGDGRDDSDGLRPDSSGDMPVKADKNAADTWEGEAT